MGQCAQDRESRLPKAVPSRTKFVFGKLGKPTENRMPVVGFFRVCGDHTGYGKQRVENYRRADTLAKPGWSSDPRGGCRKPATS